MDGDNDNNNSPHTVDDDVTARVYFREGSLNMGILRASHILYVKFKEGGVSYFVHQFAPLAQIKKNAYHQLKHMTVSII